MDWTDVINATTFQPILTNIATENATIKGITVVMLVKIGWNVVALITSVQSMTSTPFP